MRCQQIPAAEIDDGAVAGLAVGVAIGFDHADVFAFDALADGCSDQAQKHGPVAGKQAGNMSLQLCAISCAIRKLTRNIFLENLSLQIDDNHHSSLTTPIT